MNSTNKQLTTHLNITHCFEFSIYDRTLESIDQYIHTIKNIIQRLCNQINANYQLYQETRRVQVLVWQKESVDLDITRIESYICKPIETTINYLENIADIHCSLSSLGDIISANNCMGLRLELKPNTSKINTYIL